MDVQPQKKIKVPAYPTFEQAEKRGLLHDGAASFGVRQKALIAAAAVVLTGTLTACDPVRNSGAPMPPPTDITPSAGAVSSTASDEAMFSGVPSSRSLTNAHDAYTALQTVASVARRNLAAVSPAEHSVGSSSVDPAWHEEPDISAAFGAFLAWMQSEGVI